MFEQSIPISYCRCLPLPVQNSPQSHSSRFRTPSSSDNSPSRPLPNAHPTSGPSVWTPPPTPTPKPKVPAIVITRPDGQVYVWSDEEVYSKVRRRRAREDSTRLGVAPLIAEIKEKQKLYFQQVLKRQGVAIQTTPNKVRKIAKSTSPRSTSPIPTTTNKPATSTPTRSTVQFKAAEPTNLTAIKPTEPVDIKPTQHIAIQPILTTRVTRATVRAYH